MLANAALAPGETFLDVGTGDGLIAFGALDLVGPAGLVIFSDVSEALLDHCRTEAERRSASERCRFVQAPAEDLRPIPDGSVDVVTTRSVLIYVADKARAFAELFRTVRPGGRLSIFEPINRYFRDRRDRLWSYDVAAIADIAGKVLDLYERFQPPETDPMLNFGERDLVELAITAGFDDVHLELSIEARGHTEPSTWSGFMDMAPNPLVPTFAEAVAEALSAEEAARFEEHLRPLVESGQGMTRSAVAYMRAARPA